MQSITITITPQQAQEAIALFDLAVKSGGLNVAAVAIPLAALIQEAAKAAQEESK